MYDVKEIGRSIKYVAAEPIKKRTFMETLEFTLLLIWDVLRVFLKSFELTVNNFYKFLNPKELKKFNGKIALVTGGANGLGRAIAFQLAKENCSNIVIADLDLESARRTADEIKTVYNIKCKAYHVDVSDYEDIVKLRDEIKKDFGIVNILVNNAGIVPSTSLCQGKWKDIDRVLKVNINSNIWTTLIFMDDMIKQKDGHIVSIASIAGLMSVPYMITYATTKHAVTGFMSSLTDQLQIDGHNYIKTTCICPYIINTRKDYLDLSKIRFPPMEPEYTAKKIVDAVRKEKELEIIMQHSWLIKLQPLIPASIWRIITEIVIDPKNALNGCMN